MFEMDLGLCMDFLKCGFSHGWYECKRGKGIRGYSGLALVEFTAACLSHTNHNKTTGAMLHFHHGVLCFILLSVPSISFALFVCMGGEKGVQHGVLFSFHV